MPPNLPLANSRTPGPSRSRYFQAISGITLFLTLWGFSDNLLWNVGQASNRDPKFVVHGLFTLGWMLIFFVQASLIQLGNSRLHRRLGIAGMVVAVGTVLSTVHVFIVVWKGWDAMPFYLKANRLLVPAFSLLVLLAYRARRRPEWHRRYLLIATLCMLEPVLSRAFDPLDPLLDLWTDAQVDAAWWLFFVTVWNGLFLSLFVHDWYRTKRFHPVTIGGYAGFCAIHGLCVLI